MRTSIFEGAKLIFSDTFDKELSSLKEEVSEKDVSNMQLQGTSLLDGVLDFMKNRYGNYEVLFIEEELSEDLEFEEAARIRDEIRKLEASELEITLNPKISQYNLKTKVYPKGRSTLGMPGTKVNKKRKK